MKQRRVRVKTTHDSFSFMLYLGDDEAEMYKWIDKWCDIHCFDRAEPKNFKAMTIQASWTRGKREIFARDVAVFMHKGNTIYDVIHESEHVVQYLLTKLYRLLKPSGETSSSDPIERLAYAVEATVKSINAVRYAR